MQIAIAKEVVKEKLEAIRKEVAKEDSVAAENMMDYRAKLREKTLRSKRRS